MIAIYTPSHYIAVQSGTFLFLNAHIVLVVHSVSFAVLAL